MSFQAKSEMAKRRMVYVRRALHVVSIYWGAILNQYQKEALMRNLRTVYLRRAMHVVSISLSILSISILKRGADEDGLFEEGNAHCLSININIININIKKRS